MKRKIFITLIVILCGYLSLNGQSINFKIGSSYPSMESDLWEQNMADLYFEKQDMQSAYFGVELELFMGRNFSLALEAGRYDDKIYTAYRDFEYEDGSPIEQDIHLKLLSFEADIKWYPMGHNRAFNPYLGVGAGLYSWRYIQGGEFVDFYDYTVYEGEAETKTTTPGCNVKVGFVYRFRRSIGVSFEARYHYVKGELSSLFEGFEKLDLSGVTVNVGLNLFLR